MPVGPNNRIEPGGPDQGQPTHFLPGGKWGVFTITVPKDFGDKKLTWTLVANGKPTVIPMSLAIRTGKFPRLWTAPRIRRRLSGFPRVVRSCNGPVGQSVALAATVGILCL